MASFATIEELASGQPDRKLCRNIDEVIDYCQNGRKRGLSSFEIDGMVIKVNDLSVQEALAVHRKPSLGHCLNSAEQATTTIKDIVVKVRTGVLTPPILQPVRLAGTTVSRASLHNEDMIKEKDIQLGDTVVVQKREKSFPKWWQFCRRRGPAGNGRFGCH